MAAQGTGLGTGLGAGWYCFDARRQMRLDPDLLTRLQGWRADAGLTHRDVRAGGIVEQRTQTGIHEDARTVDDNIVSHFSDVDIVFVGAQGFPAWHGGPLWYADQLGRPHGRRSSRTAGPTVLQNLACSPQAGPCEDATNFEGTRTENGGTVLLTK